MILCSAYGFNSFNFDNFFNFIVSVNSQLSTVNSKLIQYVNNILYVCFAHGLI